MKPIKIEKKRTFWHARYDTPEQYNEFSTPAWAKKIADSVVEDAKVVIAHKSDSDEWQIEKILIPIKWSGQTEEKALELTGKIYNKINTKGRSANKEFLTAVDKLEKKNPTINAPTEKNPPTTKASVDKENLSDKEIIRRSLLMYSFQTKKDPDEDDKLAYQAIEINKKIESGEYIIQIKEPVLKLAEADRLLTLSKTDHKQSLLESDDYIDMYTDQKDKGITNKFGKPIVDIISEYQELSDYIRKSYNNPHNDNPYNNPVSLDDVDRARHLFSDKGYKWTYDDLVKNSGFNPEIVDMIYQKYQENKTPNQIHKEIEKEFHSATAINPPTPKASTSDKSTVDKSMNKGGHNPISFDGVKYIIGKGYDNYDLLVKKYDSDIVDSVLRKDSENKSPRQIHDEVEKEYHGKEGKPKNPV